MQNLSDWLFLHHAPNIGPVRARAILDRYHTPSALLSLSATEIRQSGVFPATAVEYFIDKDLKPIDTILRFIDDHDIHIIHWGHPDYPPLLAEIYDPPLVLYLRGNPDYLSMPQLAIVGSRNPDRFGSTTAHEFAKSCAANGLTITSGLAIGVDRHAHEGALESDARTIAVMGTGINRIYPASNRNLAHAIAEQGLLISEFAPDIGPKPENFPRRNRIISGLACGTLVIQAALKSGSLITARTAMEQGREVFAMPGSIHNPLSRGCHQLIRSGAKLVETVDDIFEELQSMVAYSRSLATEEKTSDTTTTADPEILQHIGYDPISIDELAQISHINVATLKATLLELELEGKIETLAGGTVQRV
jgi:DNA processing protein